MTQNSPTDSELQITKDGSHTLYSNRFDQHYHNPNGAVAENAHVFFECSGLTDALKERDNIAILEIGFGTGLNLLLLTDKYLASCSAPKIQYHSIEAFPISLQTAANLNYEEYLKHSELFENLLSVFGDLKNGLNTFQFIPNVELSVFHGLFSDYISDGLHFDFIFHDGFSPGVNPDLWTGEVFKKLLQWSSPQAILTTYCAASKVRGAMAWAGWKAARADGALGKREMTVASPSAASLSHLKRVSEERLARRYEEDDF